MTVYYFPLFLISYFFYVFMLSTNFTLLFAIFQWLGCVWFFVTPWNVAHQGPLSMEFFRQKYCSGLPFLSPGIPSWRKIKNWCDLYLKTTELKKKTFNFLIFWFIKKKINDLKSWNPWRKIEKSCHFLSSS